MIAGLWVGLLFAAPAYAGPILVSGEYSLHISGSVVSFVGDSSSRRWDQTVTQSVIGDFSDSLSDAEAAPPFAYGSSSSVTLSMSENLIQAVGMVDAHVTETVAAGFPISAAGVDLEFIFSLTEAFLVRVEGFSDALSAKSGAYSFVDLQPLPPDIVGNWNPGFHSIFSAMIEPGTYTVRGSAYVGRPGPGFRPGRLGTEFSFKMSLAPIPEPSAALAFAVGGLIVGGAVRKRANA